MHLRMRRRAGACNGGCNIYDVALKENHSGFRLLKVRSFYKESYALTDEAVASWTKSRVPWSTSTQNGVSRSRKRRLSLQFRPLMITMLLFGTKDQARMKIKLICV